MKKIKFLLLFMFGLGSLSAQSFYSRFSNGPDAHLFGSDSLKILAVMVDFQEDKYDATVGTGKFGSHYTKNYGDTIIDPLPHDSEYFSDHLLFAKNYFKKVSNSKLNISYKVLPQVLTVSKTMRDYSPGYQSTDLSPLGKFADEVWKLADQKFSGINYSDYNLFIIFHAGVSSGLNLGTFSIDRNLPSLYLSNSSLKNIFGNQFNGFQTKNGIIGNTLIMPETESREETLIDNSVALVEVSINGSLVANIASYLGLPDLFNTETGLTAIGRFGLMDGQAIGASNGMYPPEPSPWEKMYLGWEQPVVVSKNAANISLVARPVAKGSDTTLIKIPINSSEYFLVENRNQDANKDKAKITYKRSGKIYTQIIEPDTSGIYYVTPNLIPGGVVIDVDEFDSSLPGNGIVVWHIDEKIISSKIGENKINADLKNRGVYVVEADGIQDIGQIYNTVFGELLGDGDPYDFWYKGNKAKYYKNRFAPDSKPNTNSNNGANSLITVDNFTALANKITFNVSFDSGNSKLVSRFQLPYTPKDENDFIVLRGTDGQNYFLRDGSDLVKINSQGKLDKRISDFVSQANLCGISYLDKQYVLGASKDILNIYVYDLTKAVEKVLKIKLPFNLSSQIVLFRRNGEIFINAGTSEGYLLEANLSTVISTEKIQTDAFTKFATSGITQVCRPFDDLTGDFLLSTASSVINGKTKDSKSISGTVLFAALTHQANGTFSQIILHKNSSDYFITVVKNNQLTSSFKINSGYLTKFSVADLLNNGEVSILINNGSRMEVYNLQGAMLTSFPIDEQSGADFNIPLAVDLNKDGNAEILCTTNFGKVYAFNPSTGKLIDGYPISSAIASVAPFIYSEELPTMGPLPTYKPYLVLLDNSNYLNVWNLSSMQGKAYWSGSFGNSTNNSSIEITAAATAASDFFPSDKAYNWPNPVYGKSTNIRYYVSENSTVNIKIFDLSGIKVAELNANAAGGYDNETMWDVSNVQSGVYYARLEVNSESGKTGNKLIKIAVIK